MDSIEKDFISDIEGLIDYGLAVFENSKIIQANNAFIDMFNLLKNDIPYNNAAGLFSSSSWETILRNIFNGTSSNFEAVARKKNGKKFPCLIRGKKLGNADQKLYFVSCKDLSQNSELADKLYFEKEKLSNIFNSISAGIFITDPKTHKILFSNSELDAFLRFNPVGHQCHKIMRGKDNPCHDCAVNIIMNNPKGVYRREVSHIDGKIVFLVSSRLIKWEKDSVAILEMAIDITKQKKMENQLFEKSIELERKNNVLEKTLDQLKEMQDKIIVQQKMASLGSLTAGIAHEIKNPLNFVNNFSEITIEQLSEILDTYDTLKNEVGSSLKNHEMSDEFESLISDISMNISKIKEHGSRADSIVKQMMLYSRGNPGEKILSDINTIVEEALNLSYHGMRARDVTFNSSINKELDNSIPSVRIIAQDINRALINIISNAFYAVHFKKKNNPDEKYSPQVSVHTQYKNDKIHIIIRDNGSGISKENKDKIFNPFFTTKSGEDGLGLGLSICYNMIVNEHRGEIAVNSEENEFTEFTITLPADKK